MKRNSRIVQKFLATFAIAGGVALLGLAGLTAKAQVTVTAPFEESGYLWNQAYDTAYGGDGQWGKYKAWLNLPQLGAETDGGGSTDDWWGSCELPGWNFPWGTQQSQFYGSAAMPDILLGDWQMPFLSNGQYDQVWALEAANDPATMQHFVQFAKNVLVTAGTNNNWSGSYASKPPTSVIVRLGYEFDGGWNPFGNLNVRANMPNNYIQSWRNIVNTVRANDPQHIIKFCWNPTDSNVQINSDSYYPGDAWVDYIGVDTYDKVYSGEYTQGTQPSATQQTAAWNNVMLPHLNYFTNLSATHKKPLIVGEWGTWDTGTAPGGGDDPAYIQRMYNWMVQNHVGMECYFEYASDGDHQLWPGGNASSPRATVFPQASAKYRDLFGASYSYGTAAAAIPGTVSSANYDTGGQGIAFNQTINGSQTGGRPDNSSADYGPGIGWTGAGQWYKYTVNVAAAGTYTIACNVNAPTAGGTFHLEDKSGQNLTGTITCPSTGNWNTAGTATATVTLPAGPQVLKWVQDSSGFNLNSMTFTATSTAPVFTEGFESGNLNAWSLWVGSNGGASFAQNCGSAQAHSGTWEYTSWSSNPYQLTLYKNVTVPNGSRTVSAWIKSSGGQSTCQMEVTTNGVETIVPISASAGWTQISATVPVTTGVIEIGFYSNAAANQWLNVDDITVK